jgi:hypothetical protein
MDNQTKEFITNEAEAEDLKDFIRSVGAEEKGIDNFFLEIIRNHSLKVGNLDKDELGMPQLPIRTLLELKRDCEIIPSMSSFAEDFERQAEETIASSLSKEGFLIKARTTQRKEFGKEDKRKQRRKGLFGRKEELEDE